MSDGLTDDYAAGANVAALAAAYDLSKSAVYKRAQRAGLRRYPVEPPVSLKAVAACLARGLSLRAAADEIGVNRERLRRAWRAQSV